jgi:hypothetical protein
MLRLGLLAFAGLALCALPAQASLIDFEGFAPAGGLVNISPGSPYTENGFTLTPTNASSAVFDSAAANTMIGNNTDWFGFAESNTPILTLTSGSGVPFTIHDLLIGPSTIASGTPISMRIVGNLNGGGTVGATFNGLTTATNAFLNWSNLDSVVFFATDDAALDNIRVTPEPATLALLGIGVLAVMRRRCKTA